MAFEMLAVWVLVGLLAGGLAGAISRSGSYGPIGDVLLGLVGSFAAGTIFRTLGVMPGAGRLTVSVVACLGAAGVLAAQRKLWPRRAARPRRRRSVASGAWRAEQE
jgi:uncharacterized membrane protein YeaQ/YmgE (transglycosylase-associated protein family)